MYGYILTNILGYGGAVAAVFNPFLGVCIYWAFELIRPQHLFAFAGPPGPYSNALAIGTLIGWAAGGFGNFKLGRAKPVVFFLGAHAIWALVATIASPEPDLSFRQFQEYLKVWLMFLVAVSLIDTADRTKILAWVIAGSSGYISAEFNQIYYLRGANYIQQFGHGGMDSNSFAIVLVTTVPVGAYLGLYSRKLWQKGLAFACVVFALHAIMLSFSRGAFVGALTAGIVAVVVTRKKPSFIFACVLGAIVVLRLAGPSIREEFSSVLVPTEELDGSAQSRIQLWKDCLTVMERYPLLGVGPARFSRISAQFGWPPGKEAHTLWLSVGAEMGVPALIFLLGFYGTTALLLVRPARSRLEEEPGRWLGISATMIVVCLGGFAVSAQFVSMAGLESPYFIVALGIATIRLAQKERATAAERELVPRPTPGALHVPVGPFGGRQGVPSRH